jgi:hypothetical protein
MAGNEREPQRPPIPGSERIQRQPPASAGAPRSEPPVVLPGDAIQGNPRPGNARSPQPAKQASGIGWVLPVVIGVVVVVPMCCGLGGLGLWLAVMVPPRAHYTHVSGRIGQADDEMVIVGPDIIDRAPPEKRRPPPRREDLIDPPPPPKVEPAQAAFKEVAFTGFVWGMDLSPDGTHLATATRQRISIWNVATGKEIASTGCSELFPQVRFSADGKSLVTPKGLKALILDVATCDEKRSFEMQGSGSINSAALAPDGKSLAASAGGEVFVWDVATGARKSLVNWRQSNVLRVRYSPDGKRLHVQGYSTGNGGGMDGINKLLDATTGNVVGTFDSGVTGRWVRILAPDFNHFAEQSMGDKEVKLGMFQPRKNLPSIAGQAIVTQFDFAPDSNLLAIGYIDGMVKLWDCADNRERKSFRAIERVENGNIPILGGDDAMFDHYRDNPEAVRGVLFSGNGTLLGIRTRTSIRFWETAPLLDGAR